MTTPSEWERLNEAATGTLLREHRANIKDIVRLERRVENLELALSLLNRRKSEDVE